MTAPFDLGRPRTIHVIGCSGTGMSPITTVLAAMGHRVSGSDTKDGPVIDRLRSMPDPDRCHPDQRVRHLDRSVESPWAHCLWDY